MKKRLAVFIVLVLALVPAARMALGSAYNARPKLVVVVVVDQMRGDFLDRYAEQFGEGGFRVFLDRGAVFTEARYEHAGPRTSVGHATLATGSYIPGHSILANEWWEQKEKRRVTSVQDDGVRTLGPEGVNPRGSSPRRLMATTLGDELKLATGGRARVFATSLKDTAANMSAGRSADAAYWADRATGLWVTSSYYMKELPAWVSEFNAGQRAEKYWDLEWKDAAGNVLRTTQRRARADGSPGHFYDIVGPTIYGDQYQLEFARELIEQEKLGQNTVTDMLIVSLSATDKLGHEVGPDSAQAHALALALDRQLAEFFAYLGRQIGLANVWLVLTSDHGASPLPETAQALRLGGAHLDTNAIRQRVNAELSRKLSPGKNVEYVTFAREWPIAHPSEEAFAAVNLAEDEAERLVGEAMQRHGGWLGYVTRAQLARGELPADALSRRYANTYTPHRGWYVLGIIDPYIIGWPSGTDHSVPLSYDVHVPVAFYGLPFQAGRYRERAEVVDVATTLASLLGIGRPSHAVGRVLTEALAAAAAERGR